MLMAAFVAAAVAYGTGSPWIGALAAIIVSVLAGLLHGFACIIHRGNQDISGLAINILASGLTVIIGIALFRQGGQTPTLPKSARFNSIELPFAQYVADNIPILGVVYKELISGHNILVWLALASVVITYYILFKTTFGLRLRAVGEKPEAIDSAGISVSKMRFQAIIIAGILCGLAGVYLSTATGAGFVKEMTAGKGYIALAAMIFGKWRPVPALYACLMFGFLEAVAARVQGAEFPFIGEISSDLLLALPYVLTVVLLAGFIGGVSPPRAIGQPYIKER
jgi:simple sugar transport system permease protein